MPSRKTDKQKRIRAIREQLQQAMTIYPFQGLLDIEVLFVRDILTVRLTEARLYEWLELNHYKSSLNISHIRAIKEVLSGLNCCFYHIIRSIDSTVRSGRTCQYFKTIYFGKSDDWMNEPDNYLLKANL